MNEQARVIVLPAKNSDSVFSTMRGAHIALRVADYAGTVKWYQEKLDFRLVHEWPFGDMQLAYLAPANDDNFWIEILGGGQPGPKPIYTDLNESLHPAGYHHFCIDVVSVDDTIAALASRSVAMIGEPFNLPAISKRLAFLADLEGNLIELAERISY
jgi:catechol 2,3-dioxygenase-like lactoylglutathione lyase family enzyme